MLLNNRHGSVDSDAYRYGFNGMEKDDEVSGSGNSYTAQFWQYDPRLGRRWNIDPVVVAHESPYAAFRNNPVFLNDPNGDCPDCDENAQDAKVGDIHVSKDIKPFKSPNGYMLSGTDGKGFSLFTSDDLASISWVYMGKDAGWQAMGFETKGGERYAWDSDKMWYSDPAGKEFDDHISFDVTNWSGDAVKPAVQAFVDDHTKGDALHSFRKAYHQSGSSLTSFVWDGVTNAADEIGAGGHRRSMMLGSMYSSYLMSGGPVGVSAGKQLFSNINSGAATTYLYMTGELASFSSVEGFNISLGATRYIYHSTYKGALRGGWWTSTRFSSQASAFSKLGLHYPGTMNFANKAFKTKITGLSIKGTAAPQGLSTGGGIQYMGIKNFFSKANLQSLGY